MNADDLSYGLNQEIYHKNGRLWNDGWYLYSSGEVSGPYEAKEIFLAKNKALGAPEQFFVSRKGLSRWYELAIVSEIYSDGNNFLKSKRKNRNNKRKNAKDLKVQGKVLGFKKNSAPANSTEKKSQEFKTKSERSAQTPPRQNPKKAKISIKGQNSGKPQDDISPVHSNSERSLAYHHLILKGRLRLGTIQSEFKTAFLKIIFSIGYFLKSWYEQALIETTFHLDDPMVNARINKTWMILIPGYHLLLFYRLGKLILQMEVQNHYKKTSPMTVLILGLFPPLAVYYLQNAMNRHWKLHVAHSVKHQGPFKTENI